MRGATVLALLVAVSVVQAGATLDGVKLGTHVTGPRVNGADLEGRVVVFEYWGVNCPPCRASIPKLVSLQGGFDRTKLVVVASHCQDGTVEEVAGVWLSLTEGKDNVSVVNFGSLPGANVNGIPHAFVFDHTGKLVFEGNPHDARFSKVVVEAARAAPGFLAAGREYEVFRADALRIGSMRSNLATSVQRLRVAAADAKAPGHDEAKFLLDRLTTWANTQYQSIATDPAADAILTQQTLKQMLLLFTGDELGVPFVELNAKLAADATFANEVGASELMQGIRDYARSHGLNSPSTTQAKKASVKQTVLTRLEQLISRYPDTRAAQHARDMQKQLG